ncbi:MAG: hypothetical protein KBA26_04695 [Candidatus Delongbacteria bacterium]|nr:hypothetical protein [Candidatus Delongbacteria bacterium]
MDIKDLSQLSSSALQPLKSKSGSRKNDPGEAARETPRVESDRVRISNQSYQRLQEKNMADEIQAKLSNRDDTGGMDERLEELKHQIQQGTYLNSRRDAAVSRQMFSIWSDDEPIE